MKKLILLVLTSLFILSCEEEIDKTINRYYVMEYVEGDISKIVDVRLQCSYTRGEIISIRVIVPEINFNFSFGVYNRNLIDQEDCYIIIYRSNDSTEVSMGGEFYKDRKFGKSYFGKSVKNNEIVFTLTEI